MRPPHADPEVTPPLWHPGAARPAHPPSQVLGVSLLACCSQLSHCKVALHIPFLEPETLFLPLPSPTFLSSSFKIPSCCLRATSDVPFSWAFPKLLAGIQQFILQFCRAALYIQNKQTNTQSHALTETEIIPISYETCCHPAFTIALSLDSHSLWSERGQSSTVHKRRAGTWGSETSDLRGLVRSHVVACWPRPVQGQL